MNAAEKIIEKMSHQFTRQDILRTAKKLGYSYSTANGVVDRMIFEDMCKRTGNGVYQKLEEPEPVLKDEEQAEDEEDPEEWVDDFEDNFLDDIEI